MRRAIVALLGVLIVALVAISAQGMEFETQANGGNCEECAWILAEGRIDAGTTEKFKAFLDKESPGISAGGNIRFDSPGGDVMEALKFGQFLRESNWNTFVGEESVMILGKPRTNRPHTPRPVRFRTQKSVCYSACVYAFAGGVHRTADAESVGIHQFYRPDVATRPNDKTLSAVDVANMQRIAALLNEYVRQMGVDPRLVTIASSITPWEPIYLLSGEELRSLNLDNTSAPSTDSSALWSVEPFQDGAVAITTQPQNGADRVASLGIMCLRPMAARFLVQLAVRDDTKDWSNAFSSLDLTPLDFTFSIDGDYGSLDANRLVGRVERVGNGASLTFAISKEELEGMMKAKSVEIAGFTAMVTQRWIGGELGGTFSMAGASSVIDLALRNCISNY